MRRLRRTRPPKSGAEAAAMFRAMTDTGPAATHPDQVTDPPSASAWRDRVSDILDIAGLAGVSAAAWLVYLPAGIAVAGLSCVLLSWKISRGG